MARVYSNAERAWLKEAQLIANAQGIISIEQNQGLRVAFQLLNSRSFSVQTRIASKITLDGFPVTELKTANNDFVATGRITPIQMQLDIKSAGFAVPFDRLDIKSIKNVGSFGPVIQGLSESVTESVINIMSGFVNGLSTGTFDVKKNDGTYQNYGTLLTYGDEVVCQASRTTGHWYQNGVNVAPNMGSSELSADSLIAALNAVAKHKTIYGTTISVDDWAIIVDRSKYMETVHELVTNSQFGDDLQKRAIAGVPVGWVDMEDPRDWLLVTNKADIGFMYFENQMFPLLRDVGDLRTENEEILCDYDLNVFAAQPTGLYLNKF